MPLNPLQPPFVPANQAYLTQKRTSFQETNSEKKKDNQNSRIVVTESKQEVDELVKCALDLTWDTCFDGTQIVFKEPETLTVFREELQLDPAEEEFVRFMADSKRQNLVPALKLREIKALQADKLFMKISPMDCRLKREQDVKMHRKFKFYKHILHAPKNSRHLSACIPSHPWPNFAQPLTCLHCNLTSDYFNIYQLQLSTYNLLPPHPEKTSEVRILHNKTLCPYHDYYLHTRQSLGYHELTILNIFQQHGILFGTERGRTPYRTQKDSGNKYGEQSHLRCFIDRLREEVLEKRGHLVTTEEDMKVGTFLKDSGSNSKDLVGAPVRDEELERIVTMGSKMSIVERRETSEEEKVKRLGSIGDGRPIVRRREVTEEEEVREEETNDEEDTLKEAGPPSHGASLADPE